MKSTGIVRKVDELGRIVLPIELRRTLDIAEKDSMEIYIEGDTIILKKYQPACIFCDNARDIVTYRGKPPLQARMVAMSSSTMSVAFFRPSRMWARSLAFFRSYWVRRRTTSS